MDDTQPVWQHTLFTKEDISRYNNGRLYNAYEFFGNHPVEISGTKGYYFAVWAPAATAVSITGDFNNWEKGTYALFAHQEDAGIWEGFIPGFKKGDMYKYYIHGYKGALLDKGDPYANFWEKSPGTASVSWNLQYHWDDAEWMRNRKQHNALSAPWSVYELQLASWIRPDKNTEGLYCTYREITERLIPYVSELGFTHIELMPVMEYPYDGSWGYQGAGFFAPTSRFGLPEDLMFMIDSFHKAGIGVILDWVPSHFPYDAHGLFMFDGTHAYEYADMRKGYHPDWKSYIFDYAKGPVKSFLVSSALFWFDKFHIDGIRVDAVSSMLMLDYSRKEGEWVPNEFGGNANIEAIMFLKELNQAIYREFPDVQTIGEESTDWPKVSRPISQGGLGFGMKWMLGWMHDTLDYFTMDPWFRQFHQDKFVFSMAYFYNENFMLPLSHDEVVHGKRSLLNKMPGDEWQKFASLRLLYTYMFTHPGAKLLFMGDEFAQTMEWNYKSELDWGLLQSDAHKKLKACVTRLNFLYRDQPALHVLQFQERGFEWIDLDHPKESVIAYKRKGINLSDDLLIILNMTPVIRNNWKLKVYGKPVWKEIFNSDQGIYGGTNDVSNTFPEITMIEEKTLLYELSIHLPPLAGIIFQ